VFHRHPFLSLLTFAYLGFVGWMTLTPQASTGSSLMTRVADRVVRELQGYEPTSGLSAADIEFAANVAMFVPVGMFFLLLLGRRQWWLAVLAGLVLTLGIEAAQQEIPGRVSDPRDVVSNGAGTAIGVVLAWVLTVGEWFRAVGARRAAARTGDPGDRRSGDLSRS